MSNSPILGFVEWHGSCFCFCRLPLRAPSDGVEWFHLPEFQDGQTLYCSERTRGMLNRSAGLKLWMLIMLCIAPAAMGAEGATEEPANKVEFSLDATYNSKYIWRGINLADTPVFQPSAAISYSGFTAAVWGNMETTNDNKYVGHGDAAGDFTEVDYSIDYMWTVDRLNFSLGAIYYDFPNTGFNSTSEVYGAVGLDAVLSPAVTVYKDIDEADGIYATFSAGHSFEEVWKPSEETSLSLDLSGSVGYGSSRNNRFYYGASGSGFTDVTVSAGLPLSLGESLVLSPAVNCSVLLDGSIRRAMTKDDNVWFGISLTYSF